MTSYCGLGDEVCIIMLHIVPPRILLFLTPFISLCKMQGAKRRKSKRATKDDEEPLVHTVGDCDNVDGMEHVEACSSNSAEMGCSSRNSGVILNHEENEEIVRKPKSKKKARKKVQFTNSAANFACYFLLY